jgi:hypothetical protein
LLFEVKGAALRSKPQLSNSLRVVIPYPVAGFVAFVVTVTLRRKAWLITSVRFRLYRCWIVKLTFAKFVTDGFVTVKLYKTVWLFGIGLLWKIVTDMLVYMQLYWLAFSGVAVVEEPISMLEQFDIAKLALFHDTINVGQYQKEFVGLIEIWSGYTAPATVELLFAAPILNVPVVIGAAAM